VSASSVPIDGPVVPVDEGGHKESLLTNQVYLGMVMFLGSEAMLFGSFFTAFFYLRFTNAHWPSLGLTLPIEATGINTAILISSSFTMHWALVSVRRNNRFGLVLGLGLTLMMGVTFLALQIHEYITLGFSPSTDAFASAFFALTGLHGFHVLIGATLLTIAFVRSSRGHYSADEHLGLEVTGLYWHFVDVVWILLYTVVYLL
jgi:cytochrome c oxidase subunit III